MPKYSVEPSKWQGSGLPRGLPVDVIDASGRVIDKDWIVYFDTDAGVVISSVRDEMGMMKMSLSGEPKYLVEVYPAPLTFRPYRKPKVILSR